MSKKLVAYFSAGGVTAAAAKRLADAAGADLYEIRPEVPYQKKDLIWVNPLSRSIKEMRRKSNRPPIIADGFSPADYDVIYLGFPIWCFVAPTIVLTFLEAYDFSNKKIVVFATSGGSGLGKTLDYLKPSLPDSVTLTEGGMLNGELTEALLHSVLQA